MEIEVGQAYLKDGRRRNSNASSDGTISWDKEVWEDKAEFGNKKLYSISTES